MPKTLFAQRLNTAKPLFTSLDTVKAARFEELQAEAEKQVLSPLQASRKSVQYTAALRHAIKMAARLAKFEIDPESDKKVSITALDRALSEADVPILERFELKAALAQAGLIL